MFTKLFEPINHINFYPLWILKLIRCISVFHLPPLFSFHSPAKNYHFLNSTQANHNKISGRLK